MKNQELRTLMLENKTFLAELYLRDPIQVRKEIILTDDKKLRVIIWILYKIASGEIPLSQESKDLLSKKRKLSKLHNLLGNKQKCKALSTSDRKTKLEALLQFSTSYKFFFHWIFNDPTKKAK